MKHAAILTALSLAIAGAHSTAEAQQQPEDSGPSGTLRLGKLYSFGGGADLQHGFGMDLRYELYPEGGADGYVGILAQGEYQTGDAWRFVGGLSGGWGAVGLEAGISHRTATALYAGSTGLHVGGSIALGPLSIGGRLTVPLVDHLQENVAEAPAVQGIEAALVLRMSFGFTLHGERRSGGACHGHGHRAHGSGHGDLGVN